MNNNVCQFEIKEKFSQIGTKKYMKKKLHVREMVLRAVPLGPRRTSILQVLRLMSGVEPE